MDAKNGGDGAVTMLKLIGGLGLFGACTGVGWYGSHRMHRRVALLSAAESLCCYVASRIEYGCVPFREIWRCASTLSQFEILTFLKDADTSEWKMKICKEINLYKGELTAEDMDVLQEWVQELGNTDVNGQIEHANRCRERIAERLRQARDKVERVGKLYTVLGGLCGAAAVLLVW